MPIGSRTAGQPRPVAACMSVVAPSICTNPTGCGEAHRAAFGLTAGERGAETLQVQARSSPAAAQSRSASSSRAFGPQTQASRSRQPGTPTPGIGQGQLPFAAGEPFVQGEPGVPASEFRAVRRGTAMAGSVGAECASTTSGSVARRSMVRSNRHHRSDARARGDEQAAWPAAVPAARTHPRGGPAGQPCRARDLGPDGWTAAPPASLLTVMLSWPDAARALNRWTGQRVGPPVEPPSTRPRYQVLPRTVVEVPTRARPRSPG